MQVILEVVKKTNNWAIHSGYETAKVSEVTEEEAANHSDYAPDYGYFFVVADVVPAEIVWVEEESEDV